MKSREEIQKAYRLLESVLDGSAGKGPPGPENNMVMLMTIFTQSTLAWVLDHHDKGTRAFDKYLTAIEPSAPKPQ